MERKSGVEALKTLPFKQVVLPLGEAVEQLTIKTKAAARNCILWYVTQGNLAEPGNVEEILEEIVKDVSPGGLSLSEAALTDFYSKIDDTTTYMDVMDYFAGEMIPYTLSAKPYSRNPGVTSVGFILDLIEIVDPEIATYDEKVAVVIEALRAKSIAPFRLGVWIDDSINLRGEKEGDFECLMDIKDAAKFAGSYLKQATPSEQYRFADGFSITLDELHLRITSFGLN